jgi:homoserine O-acetyltransferase
MPLSRGKGRWRSRTVNAKNLSSPPFEEGVVVNTRIILIAIFCVSHSLVGIADDARGDQQEYAEFSECRLLSGESIAPCRIGYRTYGTLDADRTNAILVPTWYTGTSADHAYLASQELIDPDRYFVIIIDALANGVSSSPSNSETQANGRFPEITITDMVNSQHRLLTEVLGIPSLHGVVGLSMGGMQAFEWAVRYPGFSRKAVAAIGSPRLPTFDIALWTTNNRLLALYRECECKEAVEAMAGFGMTLLVPTMLEQEVGRQDAVSTVAARGEARRESISIGQTWDQQRQAEAMINHDIGRDFGNDLRQAADRIESEFLIIVGADDRVVTPQPARDFAALIDAQLIELDEDCGHGDPRCAPDEFATLVRGFLAGP